MVQDTTDQDRAAIPYLLHKLKSNIWQNHRMRGNVEIPLSGTYTFVLKREIWVVLLHKYYQIITKIVLIKVNDLINIGNCIKDQEWCNLLSIHKYVSIEKIHWYCHTVLHLNLFWFLTVLVACWYESIVCVVPIAPLS